MLKQEKTTSHLRSKKSEARGLLKKCFKNPIFSFVPFEIWKDIVVNAEFQSIAALSQTSWAFRELVEVVLESLELCLRSRREGYIEFALKCLLKCANGGNSTGMFHLGYAYFVCGWGLSKVEKKAAEWFMKSAECGNASAMACLAYCLARGVGLTKDNELSLIWAKKALSSNHPFAVGYCLHNGLGTSLDEFAASESFEISAKQGDEFSQIFYGQICEHEDTDDEKAFFWYLKSAEQGFAHSQFNVASMYLGGQGCSEDKQKALVWFKKAAKQNHQDAKDILKDWSRIFK